MTSVSADRPGAREEPGEEELSRIDALEAKIGEHGWLSNLVWNLRNRYLAYPASGFTAPEVRMVIEAFLAEVDRLRAERDEALARIAAVEDERADSYRRADRVESEKHSARVSREAPPEGSY